METFYILYETTNLINGKKYRGIHKTNKLEDGYLGSGTAFEMAVKKYGKENFTREILEFCESYDELLEREKIYVDEYWVKDNSNYNLKTGGQSGGILSDDSKSKISETLKRKYASGEIIHKNIGKKFEPLTPSHKESISKTIKYLYLTGNFKGFLIGNEPWNKGKKGLQEAWNKGLVMGEMSEEEKLKRSNTLKERYKNQEHHSKGVEPWNKGKKGLQEAWNKGKEMDKVECPHCSKLTDVANGKRWHFDNCKEKPIED